MRRTLILMAKTPRAGRVKTRLAAGIGTVPAVWWYRHQVARAIGTLRDPRWQLVLAVTPDFGPAAWPIRKSADLPRVGQGRGDLGTRMRRLLVWAPPGPVLVVGADIPDLGVAHVARAFGVLGTRDAVFGPATDGGFWGVGLRRRRAVPPLLFAGARWSGPQALADSVATCAGLSVGYGDELCDIDTSADLKAWQERTRCAAARAGISSI